MWLRRLRKRCEEVRLWTYRNANSQRGGLGLAGGTGRRGSDMVNDGPKGQSISFDQEPGRRKLTPLEAAPALRGHSG